jgi:hypothetical protein
MGQYIPELDKTAIVTESISDEKCNELLASLESDYTVYQIL